MMAALPPSSLVSPLAWVLTRPGALIVLALAVPIALLHYYARRRRRLVVPHVGLLREAMGPTRETARFRRLRDRASLLLRLLALALVALALAGLAPAPPPEDAQPLAIVIDGDRSMGVFEADGSTRLDQAKVLADALIGAHPAGPVSVIVATRPPRVLVAPTEDHAAARRALAELPLAASDLRSSLAPAVALAMAAPETTAAQVVVVSAREIDKAVPEAVSWLGVGAVDRDVGIVDLSVRDAPDGQGLLVRTVVRAEGAVPEAAVLEMDLQDESPSSHLLRFDEKGEAVVEERVAAGRAPRRLALTVSPADAYTRNDRAVLVLPASRLPRVLVVHEGDGLRPYTLAVLRGLADRIDGEGSGAVARKDLARAPRADVYIADGVALPPEALTDRAWLFLAPMAGALPFSLGPDQEQPQVWRTRGDHPLMEGLRFVDAQLARAQTLRGSGVQPLAWVAGDAVIAEGERAGSRWVAIGVDPEASDLVLRAAWPLLLERAILRLVTTPTRLLPPIVRAGEPLRPTRPMPGGERMALRLGAHAWNGPVRPEGETTRVPADLRGLLTLRAESAGGTSGYEVGVIDAGPKDRIAPARPAAALPAPAKRQGPWANRMRILLLLAALAFLLVDLFVLRQPSRT